jgi:hypothetical protein
VPGEAKIDTRSARRRLAIRREPYWRKMGRDRHLGYRKSDTEGTWIARYRDHTQQRQYQALGPADDVREANGTSVLSFEQAQERARDWFAQIESGGIGPRRRGAYTIADCMADYLAWAKLHRKSHRHLEVYIRAYILPKLGNVDTAKLTTAMLREWQNSVAAEPPRLRTRRGGTTAIADAPRRCSAISERRDERT